MLELSLWLVGLSDNRLRGVVLLSLWCVRNLTLRGWNAVAGLRPGSSGLALAPPQPPPPEHGPSTCRPQR